MQRFFTLILCLFSVVATAQNPVAELVERIDGGSSKRFVFDLVDQQSEEDFFVISTKKGRVAIEGNNWISVATGLNWYLKYHAGVNITWNNARTKLNNLPKPKKSERHSTNELLRYYLNYCTFSYSMAFWGWERWQQEIDFMALHGINLPLALTGTTTVWRNTMLAMGYSAAQVDRFVAGPGFEAWWAMNNLEGWGGPNTNNYYESQVKLEQRIVAEYKKWGIEPVYAGYSGMYPSFSAPQSSPFCDVITEGMGSWCGYTRPSFLSPTDERFAQVATIYYEELEKLFGKAKYYAMDPFHEGGVAEKVDLEKAGQAIYDAMQKASKGSVWVVQAWQDNPRAKMIDRLPRGGVIVLDLASEFLPQWGDPQSDWYRKESFLGHQWIYNMLLNFGANVGMFGKMQRTIDGYYLAKNSPEGLSLVGVGATMEGIENNPMMYEMLFELPWRKEKFTAQEWLQTWVFARYGRTTPQTLEAWQVLGRTAYNPPYLHRKEGTSESVFCSRPALSVNRVSSWGYSELYYDEMEFRRALSLMCEVADKYKGCNNFEYDIVDVARQALANYAYFLLPRIEKAFDKGDVAEFGKLGDKFLEALLLQDKLLSSRREFMVGPWIESAMQMGATDAERDWLRLNARTQITTWGNRHAANVGGLRDYAHKEWAGLLRDFYYPRWSYFFDYVAKNSALPVGYDYYDMEEIWAKSKNPYDIHPSRDAIAMAQSVDYWLKKN